MNRSRVALLAALALVMTASLTACSNDLPELTDTVEIDLGGIALEVKAPEEHTLSDGAIGLPVLAVSHVTA